MFKLYSRAGSGSIVVEAVLEYVGAEYQLIDAKREENGRAPANLLALNPLGQVPVLLLPDNSIMTESAAMVIYLADLFPAAKLAPAVSSSLRGPYLRWLTYLAANIYMTELLVTYPQRYSTESSHAPAVKAAALIQEAREWQIFSDALGDGPFMFGKEMTAVDIYAAMLADWNVDVPVFFAKHGNVKRLYDRVLQVPAFKKVWTRNGV